MKAIRITALLTVVTFAAAGCGAAGHAGRHHGTPVVLTASQLTALRGYGAGDTAFGLNVLSALCAGQPGSNVVISPVSLATGLGMAYLGARGSTAAAMARVLHLPASGASLAAGLRARAALLRSLDRPGVTFATSNRIWADPSLPTRHSFVAALKAGYQAGLTRLPLLTDPALARRRINAAIAQQTRGHIRNLIAPGSLNQVGWVLTDALYLNAAWQHPFNHAETGPGSFTTSTGRVTAKFMTGVVFPVRAAAGWTVAKLPYRGGRLSMLALLPPAPAAGHAPPASCQLPTADTIAALAAKLAAGRSGEQISIPKVKLGTSASLQQVLTSLGMGVAFGGHADFSGLSPRACCIGFVQHAATLAMAEKGTVASAATAVGMKATALPITLNFDRPYLLMLRDSLTGEPLMLAWVANPAAGG